MQIAKYTALGIPFEKVIECATVNPARQLGLLDRAGSLTAGHPADIAVFRPVDMETVHGDRPYGVPEQHTIVGHRVYQPVLTVNGIIKPQESARRGKRSVWIGYSPLWRREMTGGDRL